MRYSQAMGQRLVSIPCLLLLLTGCATTRTRHIDPAVPIEVLTPVDRVPVTSSEVFSAPTKGQGLDWQREQTMRALRADFADALRVKGATVCEGNVADLVGAPPDPKALAFRGRRDGVAIIITTEFIAYGTVRHSWLWLLAGQGLLAGIGHGIVVAKATGNPSAGWALGAGEFLLEEATWVGGTVLASRIIDPVIVRVSAIRTSDAAVLGRWTREGTRPVRTWLRRPQQPRADRLRAVTGAVFKRLTPRVLARIEVAVEAAKSARTRGTERVAPL